MHELEQVGRGAKGMLTEKTNQQHSDAIVTCFTFTKGEGEKWKMRKRTERAEWESVERRRPSVKARAK